MKNEYLFVKVVFCRAEIWPPKDPSLVLSADFIANQSLVFPDRSISKPILSRRRYGGSEESFEFPFDQHPGSHNDWYWAGSGDFVLVSREGVEAAGGYPEIAQNWQTDDLIHCRLRALGYRQVLLLPPCVTVHQNHRRVNRIRAGTRY